jgi:ABC-type multidrug transport system fused ATPase/permease subunit
MQWVVDQVLVSADRDLLAVLGLGFGLALLLQVGIGLLRGWSVVYLSSRLGLQWTGNVFAHLLKLPLDYFEKRNLGDITSRMSSVQAIQRTLTTQFVEAFIDGTMTIVTLCLMMLYSWKLTLITLFAVVVYLAIRMFAYRPLRRGTEAQLIALARQQTHLLETLRGVQSVKVAGQESLRESAYGNLMVDTVNNDMRLARMQLSFEGASQLVFGIERIAVIWVGAELALQKRVFRGHADRLPGLQGPVRAAHGRADRQMGRVPHASPAWRAPGGHRHDASRNERCASRGATAGERAHRSRAVVVPLCGRRALGTQGLQLRRRTRRIGRDRRRVGLRQNHPGQAVARPAAADRRCHPHRRP